MLKRFVSFTAVLAISGASSLSLCAAADAAAPSTQAAPATPPTADARIAPEQLLELYGWFLGQQFEVYAFGFSDSEIEALARGIGDAAKGRPPPKELEQAGPALQEFLRARPDAVKQKRAAEGKAEEQALFASVDANANVKKTESGLRYEIVAEGSGRKPAPGDTVVANYTGTFTDGTVFDSTRGGEPAEFQLNEVIRGWQEGLPLIGVGGHIKLYVPSALAYGEFGRMNIPPGKPLVFDVELVDVRAEQPKLVPKQAPPGMP